MSIYDDNEEVITWGTRPKQPETDLTRALKTGFAAIGQPIEDDSPVVQPPSASVPTAQDFTISEYRPPKSPDTSDLYFSGGFDLTGGNHLSDRKPDYPQRPEHAPYSANFNPNASHIRLPNAMGANWNAGNTNATVQNYLKDMKTAFDAQRNVSEERRKRLGSSPARVISASPEVAAPSNPVTPASLATGQTGSNTGRTSTYPAQIDHEMMLNARAQGSADLGNAVIGTIRENASSATAVVHGDHAGKRLEAVYNADPERYSTPFGKKPEMNENSPMEFIRLTRQAEVNGTFEDAEHLYQGFGIKKDEFVLGLKEFKLVTDSIMAKLDPHFVHDKNLPGDIERLRRRIAEGKSAGNAEVNRDLGDTLRNIRKSFYKDLLGQKLVDAGIFLATRNVSVAAEGFFQAVSIMSSVHANDAIRNGGVGNLLSAAGAGADTATKIAVFNKSMQVLGGGVTGPKKLLFDYLLNNLSDRMKLAVIDRVGRHDQAVEESEKGLR